MQSRAAQMGIRTVNGGRNGVSGLEIDGKEGRHALINGVYEPMDQMHNNKPCWCARAVQSTYIFHTSKSRWVISKRLDDGMKCFAFMKSTGKASPADEQDAGGDWVCPSDDGEWHADSQVTCSEVPPMNDKFVQLRMSLDRELTQLGIVGKPALKQLWKRLDYNGNGIVSLAEIDKMVVELVNGGTWPEWLNNKPALMRAYKKTILKDGDGDDWVEKKEFHALLLNIFWFNKLWQVFDSVDTGDDRRIDASEFCRGLSQLGVQISQQEAMQEFQKIDQNHGGQVLFVEFCAYIRRRVTPDAKPNFDSDIISGEKCSVHMKRALGNRATHTHVVQQKSLSKFDQLEKTFKQTCKDKTKLRAVWDRIDFNGNHIVSLAEIDKLCVEVYPLLNHKPALMRAYKATIKAGNDDDWVQKKEFKMLLGNLIYFNKIFWLFDEADKSQEKYGDRRLNEEEFKWCMACMGEKMSAGEARMEFGRVDRNGGGFILFDEFCKYVTSKKCPEALTEFVD
jgi:Ca2+-binding EF-hand superfamily protein